jgi:hypothetical protein
MDRIDLGEGCSTHSLDIRLERYPFPAIEVERVEVRRASPWALSLTASSS